MKLTDKQISELRYVANHGKPIWGGVLARGGPDQNNPEMQIYLAEGLILAEGGLGYVITDKGRDAIRPHTCPTCGHKR